MSICGRTSLYVEPGNQIDALVDYQKALDLSVQIDSISGQKSIQRAIEQLQQ